VGMDHLLFVMPWTKGDYVHPLITGLTSMPILKVRGNGFNTPSTHIHRALIGMYLCERGGGMNCHVMLRLLLFFGPCWWQHQTNAKESFLHLPFLCPNHCSKGRRGFGCCSCICETSGS
jgi:hypothetical protein